MERGSARLTSGLIGHRSDRPAPLLGMVVYVDALTLATLATAAHAAGLTLIEGGRLQLRPFPSPITRRLSAKVGPGLRSVPWPRAYADLRDTGVRGEEAAEHLREVMER